MLYNCRFFFFFFLFHFMHFYVGFKILGYLLTVGRRGAENPLNNKSMKAHTNYLKPVLFVAQKSAASDDDEEMNNDDKSSESSELATQPSLTPKVIPERRKTPPVVMVNKSKYLKKSSTSVRADTTASTSFAKPNIKYLRPNQYRNFILVDIPSSHTGDQQNPQMIAQSAQKQHISIRTDYSAVHLKGEPVKSYVIFCSFFFDFPFNRNVIFH